MPNFPKNTSDEAEAGSDPGHDRPRQRVGRVDLSQIESAHRVVPTELCSIEAQHAFKRRFDLMQVNLHHVLVRGGFGLSSGTLAEAEERIRSQLEKAEDILNDAAERTERRLVGAGITNLENYHMTPLVLQVKVFSSYGKRYLQLIGAFDQMMKMLDVTVRHGLISAEEVEHEKAKLKTELRHFANLVRDLRNPHCARSEK